MNPALLMDYKSAVETLFSRGTGADLVPKDASGGFSSVVIDSRKAEPGALFVALAGSKSDGHLWIAAAFERGAAAALVSRSGMKKAGRDTETAGKVLIVVDDTLAAFQRLAAGYLDRFPALLRVGITGSSGKTTTKEIAAAMIGGEKSVVTNQGNLNSETGLPLSVFTVRRHHEVGIFEAGMNTKGEIASLASVLRPGIALVTNIGPAHIGILGSLDAIALEKKQIFSRFTGSETALIPEDDPFADFLSAGIKGNTVLYGQQSLEADGILGAIRDRGLAGTEIVWEGIPAVFGLPGNHNVKNAVAAAAIARELKISGASIRNALGSVKPLFGRGEVLCGKTTVIRDCYNANPVSSEEAIGFCDRVQWPGRRVYVIGSMLELGPYSEKAHAELGKRVASSKCDMAFFYGKETSSSADVLSREKRPYQHTDSMDELKKALAVFIKPGDMVLLKGSRGCALEELSDIALMKGD
ncbi:MAG: UDP-N-acetylmuramoyl-tripeptide--D-alanyl-D-alanine ligase [Treponema sp.]|jgi:UDP-N-acetylmuramoyl-tripeptide--D-alanyl-D-alanine ligase|nr:UDP-N-acetylmuramoyl-tripeptide--D-alanyl-D-alanine ligase [Treponema sp.]